MKTVAVLDIGKTNLKLALVDLAAAQELSVETTPNAVLPGPPWPHFDTRAQWDFLTAALRRMAAQARIDGIAVTTHGACAALLDRTGTLAAPVLDYEHTGPDDLRAAYEAVRPPFADTGSPSLPMGLNLGAQLFWQLRQDPGLAGRIAHVVTWPQYWGFRLTRRLAADVCSLGCHTDLWNPHRNTWSALPARLGLSGKLASPRKPGEVLGILTPDLQAALGLGPVPVLVGIHDSNASLVPHIQTRQTPFAVVSTGTWVISMAVGGTVPVLDPARDTLINVDAAGAPVPSARFMGGREYELMRAGGQVSPGEKDADSVLRDRVMLLPAVVPDCGPFPGRRHGWTTEPRTDGEREIALAYSLALTTATCLDLVNAAGPTLVEGPFSGNPRFLAMLASATGRTVIPSSARTGTAVGAAMLFRGASAVPVRPPAIAVKPDAALAAYAGAWRQAAKTTG